MWLSERLPPSVTELIREARTDVPLLAAIIAYSAFVSLLPLLSSRQRSGRKRSQAECSS